VDVHATSTQVLRIFLAVAVTSYPTLHRGGDTHYKLPLATAFRGSKFNTLIYSILSGRLCGNEAPHHSVFKKKKSLLWEIDTRLSFGSCNHTFPQNPDMFTANVIYWKIWLKYDLYNI